MKGLTHPPLHDAYNKATLELKVQQALAGVDGIMSDREIQEFAAAEAHKAMLIMKDALKVIQHSMAQYGSIVGTVQKAKRDGLITDHHLEPYKLLGTSDYTPSGLQVHGVSYSGSQESVLRARLEGTFSDAAAELQREREAQ